MNLCKHCHTVFASRYKAYTCSKCKEIDDLQFEQISDYLMKYPNSNALQIAQSLNIPSQVVISYLNEGRLVTSKGRFERL